MDPLESRVAAALERAGLQAGNNLLVVAVSGGPDSMALLHALIALEESTALRLHVCHLNHNFRGEEAEEDARFVSDVAARLGLPATVEKADPVAYQRDMGISSFEEAAREVRYRFLARVCDEAGGAAVVLGHTFDDLAETVLMHLLRGSGIHGLRGMEEVSFWRGRGEAPEAKLFRPLLDVTKRDTAAYCEAKTILFREDSGNLQPRFTRNRVRHRLLPVLEEFNPRAKDALARMSRLASMEVDYLESEVARVWPSAARERGDAIAFDRGVLALLHPLLRRLLLREGYRRLTGDTRRLEESHLTAASELVLAPAGKSLDLPRGIRVHSGYDELVLGPAATACPFPALQGEHPLQLPQAEGEATSEVTGWRIEARSFSPSPAEPSRDAFSADLDLDAIANGLRVRARRPGDRFQPLGMDGRKKLQDFFVDAKVPREWRDRVPLLMSDGGIAWVVGYRIAEWAKVTDATQKVCRIEFSLRTPMEE